MKWLWSVNALLALAALGFQLDAYALNHDAWWRKQLPMTAPFNWAIQGQDAAIEGCPAQYHQWVDLPDGTHVLIGCWGKR